MNLLDGLNDALCYIEDNLDGEIRYAQAAQIACCSQYHFQRMFVMLTDVPLSEYIRRRRLTQAAFELADTEARVIDVAVKYGYTSADAFTRAFSQMHGLPPSRARQEGITLTAFPRISFSISIKGAVAMNYRIESKGAFKVVGIKEFTSTVDGVNFQNIPKMWQKLTQEKAGEILSVNDVEPKGILGLCAEMHDAGFDYWIAAATSGACPAGLDAMDVPACTWAVFEGTGTMPDALQELWKRIYGEWFPTSGYSHAECPDIEWYSDGEISAADYRFAAWIPVVKK